MIDIRDAKRDPRNEREAYSHLQRQADLKYLKHERTQVQPSFKGGRPWQEWAWAILLFIAAGVAPMVFIYFLLRGIL